MRYVWSRWGVFGRGLGRVVGRVVGRVMGRVMGFQVGNAGVRLWTFELETILHQIG